MNPSTIAESFDRNIEIFVEFLTEYLASMFNVFSDLMEYLLTAIETVFLYPPFYVIIALFAFLAWCTAGRGIAVFTILGFLLCYFMNVWQETMITMSLVLVATILTLMFAIPLGIWASTSKRVSNVTRTFMDFLQTMPPYVYLIPAIALLGFGASPAIAATALIAFAPAVRLTNLGIRQVPVEQIEVGQAFGGSPGQIMLKIKIPAALPSIMAGVNQCLMLALSMAVIAGIIGAGGLGKEVYRAIRVLRLDKAFDSGLAIVILAIILDRISQGAINLFKKGPSKNE